MKTIKFWNNSTFDIGSPKPAKNELPEWYKKTKSYVKEKNSYEVNEHGLTSNATIKKCIPVFDALTAGYLINTWSDLHINQKDGQAYYYWSYGKINFHPKEQVEYHPFVRQGQNFVAKIQTALGIETPPGYSVLLLPPMHRDNQMIILPAIIDTDTYNAPLELPFTLKDDDFEGLIPCGTPIAQVIPIKRDTWTSEIEIRTPEEQSQILFNIRKFFINSYKNNFWVRKNYN